MAVSDDILATVAAMSVEPLASDHEVVRRLTAQGYSALQAELLATFVPLAFGRVLIRRLTVRSPIALADNAVVWHKGGSNSEIRLSDVPEFTVALVLAEQALTTNRIPQEQFSRCC